MIVVTRLNGTSFALNADLVERIHANPDTTLLMVDETNYVVTETVEQFMARGGHIERLDPGACSARGHLIELF